MEELKNALLCLPCLSQKGQPSPGKPSESYINFVTKATTRVERRIKVLNYPLELIKETYESIVDENERSDKELNSLLAMRGG